MGILKGIVVRLKTSEKGWAGTADHIYVGLFGKGGGREFPLDVRGFKDFTAGSRVKYRLGSVWDEEAALAAMSPFESQPGSGQWNDPSADDIALDLIDYVYLRKAGDRTVKSDDAYALDEVQVVLYGDESEKRTFERKQEVGLANEYGLQVWLAETG